MRPGGLIILYISRFFYPNSYCTIMVLLYSKVAYRSHVEITS